MITDLGQWIVRRCSDVGARTLIAGAAGMCLSLLAAATPAQGVRKYQMSILSSTDGVTSAGVDIPIFTRGVYRYDPQPNGRSIVWLPPQAELDTHDSNDYDLIDWSRIVAVYVDEPYGALLANRETCPESTNVPGGLEFATVKSNLQRLAADVRAKAPAARFWVNFTRHEIDLILNEKSGCDINQPYIDVISMDIYGKKFHRTLSKRYDDLYANHRATAHQQLALVAGTFTSDNQSGAVGASRLSGYFDYAAKRNRRCNLPLGPTGSTGFYDGCPVWMVVGWAGGQTVVQDSGRTYYPIDHPNSRVVLDAWQSAFAVPKVDPSSASAKSSHMGAAALSRRAARSPSTEQASAASTNTKPTQLMKRGATIVHAVAPMLAPTAMPR